MQYKDIFFFLVWTLFLAEMGMGLMGLCSYNIFRWMHFAENIISVLAPSWHNELLNEQAQAVTLCAVSSRGKGWWGLGGGRHVCCWLMLPSYTPLPFRHIRLSCLLSVLPQSFSQETCLHLRVWELATCWDCNFKLFVVFPFAKWWQPTLAQWCIFFPVSWQ